MASATVVHPLPPGPTSMTPPANAGCVVVVPEAPPKNYSSYYRVLAFLGASGQPASTTIQVPASQVKGLQALLVNLPSGVSTPLAEIGAAIYQYLVGLTPPVPPNAPTGFGPIPANFGFGSLRAIVNGTDPKNGSYALAPPGNASGSAVLVPVSTTGSNYSSFYMVLAYVDASAGATTISLPTVPGILILDLPNGIYTPTTEINAIIAYGTGGGQPGGADGTMPPTTP